MNQKQQQETKKTLNYSVRKAKCSDMKIVQKLIQELADFEKMSDGPKLTEEDLIKDLGDNNAKREFFQCYVAESMEETSLEDSLIKNQPLTREIIGYAICFFSYSTWEGKSYFIEDIYVKPEHRKNGIGLLLFKEIAKTAKEFDCKRIDFHVLNWNPATEFYKHLGAKDITESEGWHFFRIELNEINLNRILMK